jgi:FMN phosphatase YigB (HAD superfamily)
MIRLILSDFDGVLSNVDRDFTKSGYYTTIRQENPKLAKNIEDFLFKSDNHITKDWMRGKISYRDLNSLMAYKFDSNFDYLNQELVKSVKKMKLNSELMDFYHILRQKYQIKVSIMSDNMDIFSEISIPYFKLDEKFDKVYNSSDLKQMKKDNNWDLPKNIAKEFGLKYEEILVVDDWEELTDELKKFGFHTFLYNDTTRNNFENWFSNNFLE